MVMFVMLCKEVLPFESMDEILCLTFSNESIAQYFPGRSFFILSTSMRVNWSAALL